MAVKRNTTADSSTRRRQPARTPEEQERIIVGKAIDLVEKQIDQGTVSAQVLSHYVKLAGEKERLEREKLRRENELLEAKVEALAEQKNSSAVYEEALRAMRSYQGLPDAEDDGYDD